MVCEAAAAAEGPSLPLCQPAVAAAPPFVLAANRSAPAAAAPEAASVKSPSMD